MTFISICSHAVFPPPSHTATQCEKILPSNACVAEAVLATTTPATASFVVAVVYMGVGGGERMVGTVLDRVVVKRTFANIHYRRTTEERTYKCHPLPSSSSLNASPSM